MRLTACGLLPMNEADILALIRSDAWMMDVLCAARDLDLPDWMIGAGFVRNKVWDHLHGYSTRIPLTDVDLIYFDAAGTPEQETAATERLRKRMPDVPWSITNQATFHIGKDMRPYGSCQDALSKWPE